MPRYQSKITGRMVSEHWAKRHPARAVELPPNRRLTSKNEGGRPAGKGGLRKATSAPPPPSRGAAEFADRFVARYPDTFRMLAEYDRCGYYFDENAYEAGRE